MRSRWPTRSPRQACRTTARRVRWLRCAIQVVSAASLGRATIPSRAGLPAGIARAATEERVVGQRAQGRVDDTDPVDRPLGVDMHPQVLQAGVPRPALQHDERDDAPDDDVRQGRRQLLRHGGTAFGLLRPRARTSRTGDPWSAPGPAATSAGATGHPSPRRRRPADIRGRARAVGGSTRAAAAPA